MALNKKFVVSRITVEMQEVEAQDHANAIEVAEHYPFPSQWEKAESYTVTEKPVD